MLVDTSVWVDHLRKRNATLAELLEQGDVSTHSFVIGELACGHLAQRETILAALSELPRVPAATHEEVLALVETRRLSGRGLGWIDMHLLASAALSQRPFWTLDKRLATVASELGLRSKH